MKISIAMATYNGERFLQEQLDSLAAQTHLPLELMVGDDRSTDKTLEILEEFARCAPFPVVVQVNERQLGHGENFLATAARCSGDWIAFCDQDDVWLSTKLGKFAAALVAAPWVDIIASGSVVTDENLTEISNYRNFFWERARVSPPGSRPVGAFAGNVIAFRKTLLSDFPWQSRPTFPRSGKKLAHDYWISMLGYLISYRYVMPDRLIRYRRHAGAVTSIENENILDALHTAWKVSNAYFAELSYLWSDLACWCENASTVVALENRDGLRKAIAKCRRVQFWYDERSKLYESDQDRRARLQHFSSLLSSDAYRQGYAMQALAKDALRTLF